MCPRPADPHAREALLRAARVEFARQGIDRARVEDVAQRAGLSKGAFYLHFPSKQDAFRELVQRFVGVLEEMAARRREAVERFQNEGPLPKSAADILAFERALDLELLETLWRNREIVAVLEGASGAPYRPLVDAFRDRMRAMLAGDVAARIAAGRLRADLDPDAVTDAILGTYEALTRRMARLREKPDLEAWIRTVAAILHPGLLPPEEARKASDHPEDR